MRIIESAFMLIVLCMTEIWLSIFYEIIISEVLAIEHPVALF